MNYKPIIIVSGEPNSIFFELFFKVIKKKIKSPIILITSKKLLLNQAKFLKKKVSFNLIHESSLIKQRKNTLDNNLKTLYKSNNTISNTNNSLISLNAQEEISGLSMRSNYMIYLFWILIFILAICLIDDL